MYRVRQDLVAPKWLNTSDLFVYLGLDETKLLSEVMSGAFTVKRQKDGKLLFSVPAAWAWDDCPLSDSGGVCMDFVAHPGPHIRCLQDLEHWEHPHPSVSCAPSVQEIDRFESQVLKAMDGGALCIQSDS
jgi:hypothetical protein